VDRLRRAAHVEINGASPRYLLIEDGLSSLKLIHTEDETFPYRGIVLLWHLARLASTLLGAATLIVIYAAALAVRPSHYGRLWVRAPSSPRCPGSTLWPRRSTTTTCGVAHRPIYAGLIARLAATWLPLDVRMARPVLGLALTTKYSVALLPLLWSSCWFAPSTGENSPAAGGRPLASVRRLDGRRCRLVVHLP